MAAVNYSIKFHINNLISLLDDVSACGAYLRENGIPEPKAKNDEGYRARLVCTKWWNRTLDRLKSRVDESELVEQGRVAKHKERYTSNLTVHRVGKKACATKEFLKNQAMISDGGDLVDMQIILDSSIANPTNRRAELMIRMAGFEVYAKEEGYVGEFYTITCPSKFHRFSGRKLNDKYECTPKDAQNYLVKQWSKIRAEYGRQGIKPFGFRVAEPHGDSCPHWHMLLFVRLSDRLALRSVVSKYALEVDGHEKGAAPVEGYDHASIGKDKKTGLSLCGARFKVVEIDSELGSATGYIAKYISKNLGFSIDDAENDTNTTSVFYGQRVKAWSSVWGIRQFQQIGGSPVTVWRQLRKISDVIDDELLESARLAADESRWCDYLKIMGGVDVKRLEQTITLVKKNLVEPETGQMKQNKYFEFVTLIFGVASIAAQVITRTKNWKMVSSNDACCILAHEAAARAAGGGFFASWSPVTNCTA